MRSSLPSFSLGIVAGIPAALHFSVILLLLVVAGEAGFTLQQALLFGLATVASLIIHVLIHVSLSRWAGFPEPNRPVTIMPFGELGLPRIKLSSRSAGDVVKALLVMLTPSFVHLGGAAILYSAVIHSKDHPVVPFPQDPVMHLFVIQATLGLINLLPLEPLDTGRVFRLLMRDKPGANTISSLGLIRTGQLIATAIGFFCLFSGYVSLFLLCAILVAASIQIVMEDTAVLAASGMRAHEVMRPAQRVDFFTHGVTISKALRIAQSSFQDVFPVVLQGRVIGLVDRRTLLETAARADHDDQYVSEIASPPTYVVNPDTPVAEVLAAGASESATIVVASDSAFEGIILPNYLSDVLIVGTIRRSGPPDEPPASLLDE